MEKNKIYIFKNPVRLLLFKNYFIVVQLQLSASTPLTTPPPTSQTHLPGSFSKNPLICGVSSKTFSVEDLQAKKDCFYISRLHFYWIVLKSLAMHFLVQQVLVETYSFPSPNSAARNGARTPYTWGWSCKKFRV